MSTLAPQTSTLLDVWEEGRNASPGARALALLRIVQPDDDDVSGWTVGQRDGALLALRARLFGPMLVALADCPACGETLEMEFSTQSITVPPKTGGPAFGEPADGLAVEVDGARVGFRLPTAGDLADLPEGVDAAEWLLRRCVEGPWRASMRSAVKEAVERAVDQYDPQADVELSLVCPACAEEWLTPFDIASFLWSEIETWALRLLEEVHVLATSYGWSERDILEFSPWRRRHYLDLIEVELS